MIRLAPGSLVRRAPAAGGGQRGMSLVEVMVALAIGVFLLAGAVSVFAKTRDLYRTNEQAARLQETARFAMSTIEADLRMASYWGLLNNALDIRNRPPDATTLPAGIDAALEGDIDACAENWAVDVDRYLEATDAAYPLACAPFDTQRADTDVLTVRHAQAAPIDVADLGGTDGQVKVVASRSQGEIFTGTDLPSDFLPPSSETRAMAVHSYYVDEQSTNRTNTPSLRRKRLDFAGGVPTVADDEVVAGVEDLQVRVGWDLNGDQNADEYLDPDTAGVPTTAVPVSVRVWLLVRADQADVNYTDDRSYAYANRAAFVPGDGFRRLLVSKTIMLRNSRR